MEQLHIMHTNDLHSHFENFPRIQRYIADERLQDQILNQETLVFDIGDATDREHPLTEATLGQANIEWMNQIHYDAVTIGNSEGLYYDHQILEHLYDQANFPVVLANLWENNGQLPHFAQAYQMLTTRQGTKIGVIGLTASYKRTYPLVQWDVHPAADVLPSLLTKLRPQVDILILLSHLGLNQDRQLAQTYPELDLIIGAHTHHLLPQGEQQRHTWLAAAGKYGEQVGNIYLDLENHHLQTVRVKTTPVTEINSQPEDQTWILEQQRKGERLLEEQVVATLPVQYERVPAPHSSLDLTFQAMEELTNCQIALLNTGLFLTTLLAGPVTENDLHRQLPHAIHVMKTTLSGQDLWRLAMEVEKNRGFLSNFIQKGMGFRGKFFGDLVWDGLEVDPRTRQVFYQHQPLQPSQKYQIALLDHYLFIPFFPTIEIMGENEIIYPDFLRTIVSKYLQRTFGGGEKRDDKTGK
ncbi:bifunctional metallophosphatase/5'-nucleotidase [Lactobacillus sp. DCY120]|uniref:Bifunctional metallophosphatase/5'-nucleotidase n=1 Tax=Bombilactobacillus apium TaxID=2675299 RepID=A0A850RD35_9LACO|nr:bifunctional UDP-sugar hydrolase/5'-nucleotidase [Bombilactobacillus apium]NVY97186.1 bifunctional metallophosphatase/5'-nucleotidase [Bombilactobacillus apium]